VFETAVFILSQSLALAFIISPARFFLQFTGLKMRNYRKTDILVKDSMTRFSCLPLWWIVTEMWIRAA